jgi:hypothetical protein
VMAGVLAVALVLPLLARPPAKPYPVSTVSP